MGLVWIDGDYRSWLAFWQTLGINEKYAGLKRFRGGDRGPSGDTPDAYVSEDAEEVAMRERIAQLKGEAAPTHD